MKKFDIPEIEILNMNAGDSICVNEDDDIGFDTSLF